IHARALVVATGVQWRRLEVPGIDDLLGAGVYYGAGPSEAVACRDSYVVIVGGGNSAGQAAVRFSNYATRVTLLVRGADIRSSMSQYLVDQVSSSPAIEVRTRSQIVGFEADGRLREILVSDGDGQVVRMPADALFVCIGGSPRSGPVEQVGAVTDGGGYLRTGSGLLTSSGPPAGWTLQRQPLPLETNLPGLFAAGDVRAGSIKRCAAAIGEGAMAVALVHQRLAEIGGD
ncbi:MAG TPA: NAD(P)/FAD-dependent oxidoreductase, partial [Candidatus Dormibacteraeota bacterium]|nr:NAD(P)/FAD-dependent oxidoreductase [Candidatus Dormibacteraeota bacterium]